MTDTITEAEAGRDFARILREVREGRAYIVTSDGEPVARIEPTVEPSGSRPTAHITWPKGTPEEQEAARQALLARLAGQRGTDIDPWTREELYDD